MGLRMVGSTLQCVRLVVFRYCFHFGRKQTKIFHVKNISVSEDNERKEENKKRDKRTIEDQKKKEGLK